MLNNTDLLVLLNIHNTENELPRISKSQIYRIYSKLKKIRLIDKDLTIQLSFVHKLLDLCETYPRIKSLLVGSNSVVLDLFRKEKTIKDVEFLSGYKKAYISRVVKLALDIGLMSKNKDVYVLNGKNNLGFIELLPMFLDLFKHNYNLPNNSIIYFISDKEVLFSSKLKLKFKFTAFSIYDKYQLSLFGTEEYYTSQKDLSIKDIFRHSLIILEKNNDYKLKIMAILFYIKYKSVLSDLNIRFVDNIRQVLLNKNVEYFPKLSELKEKGELYDIKF